MKLYKNKAKTQKNIDLTIITDLRESFEAQSQIAQNAITQREFYEEAIEIPGRTITDIDKKLN